MKTLIALVVLVFTISLNAAEGFAAPWYDVALVGQRPILSPSDCIYRLAREYQPERYLLFTPTLAVAGSASGQPAMVQFRTPLTYIQVTWLRDIVTAPDEYDLFVKRAENSQIFDIDLWTYILGGSAILLYQYRNDQTIRLLGGEIHLDSNKIMVQTNCGSN